MNDKEKIPSSFRDRNGFLFYQEGVIYRQINSGYKENYDHFINSGLYKTLVDRRLLIGHQEADFNYRKSDQAYKIIRPEPIPFISYPYEWSFSQLKDAALLTLDIQKTALDFGMSLKDCSAYNIQFLKGRPVFIDTLSFERYPEGRPWVAYGQFCRHFLGPLALMSYRDIRLSQLFRIHIDGIPLDLVSLLLPFRSRFIFPLLSHIHLHARSQKYFADKPININSHKMSRLSFLGLIDNLRSIIKKLRLRLQDTEWADYYQDTNYSSQAMQHKKELVAKFLDKTKPGLVWDLGANIGLFSRIAASRGNRTISFDMDPLAVERNYKKTRQEGEDGILPLVLDLTNPSPGLGWENRERSSLIERGPADTVLALALLHHLAISNNLPFEKLANFFSKICNTLIIEFIPKSDSQLKRLLTSREDIFSDYTQQIFEEAFMNYFTIQEHAGIRDSGRILYLMKNRWGRR